MRHFVRKAVFFRLIHSHDGRNVKVIGDIFFEILIRKPAHIGFERRKVYFYNDAKIRAAVFGNFRKIDLHDGYGHFFFAYFDFSARLPVKHRLRNRSGLFFGKRNRIGNGLPLYRREINRIAVEAFVFYVDDKPGKPFVYFRFHRYEIPLAVSVGAKRGFVHAFRERFQLSRGAEKVYAVRRADVDVSADNDNPQYCHYNHKSYNKISYCFHNFSPSPTVRTAYVYSVYRNNIFSILYEFSKNCKSILQSGFSTPFSSNRI